MHWKLLIDNECRLNYHLTWAEFKAFLPVPSFSTLFPPGDLKYSQTFKNHICASKSHTLYPISELFPECQTGVSSCTEQRPGETRYKLPVQSYRQCLILLVMLSDNTHTHTKYHTPGRLPEPSYPGLYWRLCTQAGLTAPVVDISYLVVFPSNQVYTACPRSPL